MGMDPADETHDMTKSTRSHVSSPPIADARQPHSGQSDIFFAAVKTKEDAMAKVELLVDADVVHPLGGKGVSSGM